MPGDVTLDDWFGLNNELLGIGRSVIGYLTAPERTKVVPEKILTGFVRKAVKTLESIQLLGRNGAWEEAQVLTRVIFELRVTFDCFWKMLMDNPADACQRVIDAMMLEKMKQINSCRYEGFQKGVNRPSWDPIVSAIRGRYSERELESLKKNGFTGLTVEQRSQKAGHDAVYQVMYRNLSRNVHATDFMEQHGELTLGESYLEGYRLARNHTVLFVGNWSAGGIIIQADLDDRCEAKVEALKLRQKELMKVFGALQGPPPPGSD